MSLIRPQESPEDWSIPNFNSVESDTPPEEGIMAKRIHILSRVVIYYLPNFHINPAGRGAGGNTIETGEIDPRPVELRARCHL